MIRTTLSAIVVLSAASLSHAAGYPPPQEGDFTIRDFHFHSGETLPELKLHYRTIGKPRRDASGKTANAVLILHGTGGSGAQFLNEHFAPVLFGPGQLLDASKYFIVLPDGIGHGHSSKPSDALHARFPHYDYDDMVTGHHQLLTRGLGVDHLRLVMGTSMGGMQSWVWGEKYPDFMDALLPLASLPVQIAGRNRMMRRMIMDAIRNDPEWHNGEYTHEPRQGLVTAVYILTIMSSSPLQMQKQAPTRDAADNVLHRLVRTRLEHLDANDLLYQLDASRNYNPRPELGRIQAPLIAINSADDQINPPELGILEREIQHVKRGRAVVLPITDETRGHGTHTVAALWKQYLAELLEESKR